MALLATIANRNTQATTRRTTAIAVPTIVRPVEREANESVAARATFCRKKPMRASTTIGSDEPLGDGEGHGVEPEVVAELVGEHPAQLARCHHLDGVGGHDHQVAAGGEGVDLIGVEHRQHVRAGVDVGRLGDLQPQRIDHRVLLRRRTASAEQRCQHEALHRPQEQQHPGGEVARANNQYGTLTKARKGSQNTAMARSQPGISANAGSTAANALDST